jgi:hypothetical protein
MKRLLAAIAVLTSATLIAIAPADAAARGGHGGGFHGGGFHGHGFHHGFRPGFRGSVFIGIGPYWGPYWDPYWWPYYYPPAYAPVYTTPVATEPQTYIQQSPAPTNWYYCESARGYYPYVQQCPGGWLTVVPPTGTEPR